MMAIFYASFFRKSVMAFIRHRSLVAHLLSFSVEGQLCSFHNRRDLVLYNFEA